MSDFTNFLIGTRITHRYATDDLQLELIAPDGKSATWAPSAGRVVYDYSRRPTLAALRATTTLYDGVWTIIARDYIRSDTGTFNSWGISIGSNPLVTDDLP